jgi:hypothetical protein
MLPHLKRVRHFRANASHNAIFRLGCRRTASLPGGKFLRALPPIPIGCAAAKGNTACRHHEARSSCRPLRSNSPTRLRWMQRPGASSARHIDPTAVTPEKFTSRGRASVVRIGPQGRRIFVLRAVMTPDPRLIAEATVPIRAARERCAARFSLGRGDQRSRRRLHPPGIEGQRGAPVAQGLPRGDRTRAGACQRGAAAPRGGAHAGPGRPRTRLLAREPMRWGISRSRACRPQASRRISASRRATFTCCSRPKACGALWLPNELANPRQIHCLVSRQM